MKIELKDINQNEILNNLQYRGGEIPKEYFEMMEIAKNDIIKNSSPKYTFKEFDIKDEVLKKILIGDDINKMLNSSHSLILMAVTLGSDVERLIRKNFYTNITRALMLDAAASAAVESLAEEINKKFILEYEMNFLTDRFSPGYGDMPISVQADFLDLLDAYKKIGLGVTSDGIMTPIKSITAVIGISDKEQEHRHRGCSNCRLFKECEYRKRGETC